MHLSKTVLGISLLVALLTVAEEAGMLAADKKDRTFRVTGLPTVIVRNISGSIEVRAGKPAEVKVTAASSSDSFEAVMEQIGDKIRIEARSSSSGRSDKSGSMDFFVTMPPDGNLEAHNVNGDVLAENVRGDLVIATVNGELDLRGLGKRLTAKTVNGNIALSRGQADVDLTTVSGDVTVSDLEGLLSVTSVSGDVRILRSKSARMNVTTTSGDVEMDGPLPKNARHSINSHSGNITLYLSKNSSFELSARNFNGNLQSDLPLKITTPEGGKGRSRSVRGAYGSGDATLDLQAFSGNIRIISK